MFSKERLINNFSPQTDHTAVATVPTKIKNQWFVTQGHDHMGEDTIPTKEVLVLLGQMDRPRMKYAQIWSAVPMINSFNN